MSAVHYLTRDEQRALAWSLIELTRPHLPRRERTRLVTMLGAGDVERALLDVVDDCTKVDVEVPTSLIGPLDDWARGYRGTPLERTLRVHISALRQ